VFTARYALSPYIKQIRSVFKGLITVHYKTFHHHHVNHHATFLTSNLYLGISLMVTVAIRALDLKYLVKILDWGGSRNRSRSRYIFFRLRLHLKSLPTPTPQPCFALFIPKYVRLNVKSATGYKLCVSFFWELIVCTSKEVKIIHERRNFQPTNTTREHYNKKNLINRSSGLRCTLRMLI
jgi:hypothetical protein